MTKNLLLEIGLEEMPAKVISSSSKQLAERIAQFLQDNRLEHGEIIPFSTPRRLAVMVQDIAEKQTDVEESVKGPAKKIALDDEGNWTKAASGFVRGQGLTTNDIQFKEIKGIEYIHVDKFIEGQPTFAILKNLPEIITSMTFPVSMHWANHSFNYIRPIHWITAMLDEEVIPFTVLDIESSNTSRGHRFLGKDTSFAHAGEYEEKLAKEFVIADSEKRRNKIIDQIQELARANNWKINLDEELLEEITNLVEYPTAFSGSFKHEYLEIPEEVLVTSMKDHQRYFDVRNQEGELLPFFISVRNGNAEHIENVAKGNQKVLTARLDDAKFFYEEDKKSTIENFVGRLKNVTFHEKIGTIYEKMQRVQALAEVIGNKAHLSSEEMNHLKRAAEIYKFDLVTNMVGEFPELQGVMGEKYALQQKEDPAVAQAIREHYMPISSEGALPESSVGAALAIADKLDSLLTFFAAGMIPSGSNDPYALRRQTYGVVRILIDKGWSLPLGAISGDLVNQASTNLPVSLLEGLEAREKEIMEFIKGRTRQLLSGYRLRHDVIEAVIQSKQQDLVEIVETAQIVQKHADEAEFKPTVESLTRTINLATKAEEVTAQVNPGIFEKESEQNLFNQVIEAESKFHESSMENRYNSLKQLQPFIDAFFDENMVMADDPAIRTNRLALLKRIAALAESFAALNQLVIK